MEEKNLAQAPIVVSGALEQFGAPAYVWQEVLDQAFHKPFSEVAAPVKDMIFELERGTISAADFVRPMGMSDHDYICAVVKRAVAMYREKGSVYAMMMDYEPWVYDDRLGANGTKEQLRNSK